MSLPEAIEITYDPGSGSVTKTYNRFKPESGLTVYKEANATLAVTDELKVYRTEPTRNGAFLGMAKSSCKFTLDAAATDGDGNDVTEKIIVSISTSVYPTVATSAIADAVARAAAFILTESGDDLTQKLEI